ncbi:methyltransferase domain-containing protein [Candidatus Cryosericum septentrionale]|uniref:Arsenite methyltransferase n=1 Tax=Candidatus Cryosericum septentrionale TaxID=2290913 RepID=A0A398DLL3_9BACT|nr:methyltransferase domain-containing protein [Candidatus Cryosericum septentrionale]
MTDKKMKEIVKDKYGKIAAGGVSGCGCGSGCQVMPEEAIGNISKGVGYSDADLQAVPEGANLGLGCGNPLAFSALKEGDVVLDLGSGAGFDSFLAARKVGKTGKVIGVDMTPEMIAKARANAKAGNYDNVEFLLGNIEALPLPDNSVDVAISNCVINLVPDKEKVFQELNRVLRPGGRFMVSDLVLLKELPEQVRTSVGAYVGCVAGAILKDQYLAIIRSAGFEDVRVVDESCAAVGLDTLELRQLAEQYVGTDASHIDDLIHSVASIKVNGVKRVTG